MPPIDPVNFVLSFCKDVASNPGRKRAHAVKRLTPMTLIGKATENGIDELAEKVLAPHFNVEGVEGRKVGGRSTELRSRPAFTVSNDFLCFLSQYRAWMLGFAELQGGHQMLVDHEADTVSFSLRSAQTSGTTLFSAVTALYGKWRRKLDPNTELT